MSGSSDAEVSQYAALSDCNAESRQILPSVADASHGAVVVADAPGVRASLARSLERAGLEVRTAAHAMEAQRMLGQRSADLVIVDDALATMPGVNLLEWVRDLHPHAIRVLMTGQMQLSVIRAAINRADPCQPNSYNNRKTIPQSFDYQVAGIKFPVPDPVAFRPAQIPSEQQTSAKDLRIPHKGDLNVVHAT